MINRALAIKLFEGFSIHRWNDLARPVDLFEMDRSGHKMVVAYLIGKLEESAGNKIEWEKIIYGGLFELLKKIALSDIKAQVHKMIKEEDKKVFKDLNQWVVDQFEELIDDEGLLELFRAYMVDKEDMQDLSFRVLRAAHKYSTLREFQLVKEHSLNTRRIFETEDELNRDISDFLDLKGLQLLIAQQCPYDFMADVEQLRFQVRWSETIRVPRTSVLGHSLFVACLSLLLTRYLVAPCPKRIYNNFFCGLFHDMPEAVTRDIVHPVKHATEELSDILKRIENKFVEEKLVPKMDSSFKDELLYFTGDEFSNRVKKDGETHQVSHEEIKAKYNSDKYCPVDGEIIKLCDDIAALLEADQSIEFGIASDRLRDGRLRILKACSSMEDVCGIDVKSFFQQFPRYR